MSEIAPNPYVEFVADILQRRWLEQLEKLRSGPVFVSVCDEHGLLEGYDTVEEGFEYAAEHQRTEGCTKTWVQASDNYLTGLKNGIVRSLTKFRKQTSNYKEGNEL